MKKKNKITIGTILILLILIVFILLNYYGILKNDKDNNLIDSDTQNSYNDMVQNSVMYDNEANINDLKNEYNVTGQDNLYQIDTEYDGRKVLNIKPSVDYKVAFAGMIKGTKPDFKEIDSIFNNNNPQKTGVWISKQSREKILNFLNSNEKLDSKYGIDELGYIQILEKNNQSQLDKKIEKLISGDTQYVLDISSTCYMVDPVTGEIIKNAYNDLEEYQTYEYFSDENRMIIFITENKDNKLTNDEIFESILSLF